ncbi:Protein takeout [Frankliniella fusca]|uniref:Protein takeout n=1 Tax=Frankliniella fusca TaxID=407009 RepID=A0AAE1LNI2_9NEOP|nr:Protein takeout [Frankliniella fusca]
MADDGVYNTLLLQGLGLLCLLGCGASAADLSDYVTPCKAADPDLNECVKKAAQHLFEISAKGIPELNVPQLDPATVPKLAVERDGALTMNLELINSTHHGLGGVKITKASIDPHKNEYNFTVIIPHYVVSGQYDINGRVILLPITGHGQANLTFIHTEGSWTFQGERETRDGESYLKLTKLKSIISHDTPKNVLIHFDGLFGGNKVLGDTMNHFMNENWKEITKQLKPSVQASFERRLLPVAQRFLSNFPLKKLFADL